MPRCYIMCLVSPCINYGFDEVILVRCCLTLFRGRPLAETPSTITAQNRGLGCGDNLKPRMRTVMSLPHRVSSSLAFNATDMTCFEDFGWLCTKLSFDAKTVKARVRLTGLRSSSFLRNSLAKADAIRSECPQCLLLSNFLLRTRCTSWNRLISS